MLNRVLKSEDSRGILSNLTAMMLVRGLDLAIPLITIPYIVATVGLDNYGRLAFALSFALYFGAVVSFGFGITATRDIARAKDHPNALERIYGETFFSSALLAIGCLGLAALIILTIDSLRDSGKILFYSLLYVVLQQLLPVWLFQGLEKMKPVAIIVTLTKLAYLICLFLLIRGPDHYEYIPLLNAACAAAALAAALFIAKDRMGLRLQRPSFMAVRARLQGAFNAFLALFSPNLYNNSAIFILGTIVPPAILGAFSVASTLIEVCLSFGRILSRVFLPYLARDISRQPLFLALMATVGTTGALSLFFLSPAILNLLFPSATLLAASYIGWLSLSIPFSFVALAVSSNWLMLQGYERVSRNISITVSVIFFLFALIAIPLLGVWGAIATMVGARGAMMACSLGAYFHLRKVTVNAA